MKYLIAYDISDNKLRGAIVKMLEEFAYREQKSVFIADFQESEVLSIKERLKSCLRGKAGYSIMLTPICGKCIQKIWTMGNMQIGNTQEIVVI